MLAFQGGDEEAFRTLVERHQSRVYAIIFRLVPDAAQAEDLTQEVFLRVFRTAKRYEPMAKFSTWLYRIACNVGLNAIRSARRGRTTELASANEEEGWRRELPDPRTPPPHARLDAQELQSRLADAINALPENQRIALVLSKYEHLSYDRIARTLGCSTMAVKSLLSRARCNLRDSLVRYLGRGFFGNWANPDDD